MKKVRSIIYKDGKLKLLDQRKLPVVTEFITCSTYEEVGECIREMVVRGAPAIGATAAYGMAIGAMTSSVKDTLTLVKELEHIAEYLCQTRPTAVNLFWAIDRMLNVAKANENLSLEEFKERLLEEAHQIANEDIEINRRIGAHGEKLIDDGDTILTHCNAGALATVDYGTALGVIRAAHEAGKKVHVYADETRPYLQGARLTAWEMVQEEIPVTLITDNMAGYVMKLGRIQKIIVGADRIAANGDTANKIGTYSLAVLAKEHGIPFYVAAPVSTFDFSIKTGDEIPIEERSPREVTHIGDIQIAPEGVKIFNPAFDVTPHEYITAIITEYGVIKNPDAEKIAALQDQIQKEG
ncbi:S-methyl-5-thioribose-1-phosphate isomerase [Anoxybacter fermentans]|uniref:Methylthioribose-1-phosphate isomerase n=1 Tax=Anoxybacter fermentans TaxID=1323375 RepID=A0A3S9SWH9_9FIRM|nr:S-methyl-5-thioribose-1-phosphate isomerase [Anoxybacter fermentans]AZR72693.1 S-methyl-5-thioribose-1-phosphate isomerase [Anoxybacter fermentans]